MSIDVITSTSNASHGKIELSLLTFHIIIGIVGILHGLPLLSLHEGDAIVQEHTIPALPKDWPNQHLWEATEGQPVYSILIGIPNKVLGALAITVSTLLLLYCYKTTIVVKAASKNNKRGEYDGNSSSLLIFGLFNIGIGCFGAGMGTPIAMGLPTLLATFLSRRSRNKRGNKAKASTNSKSKTTGSFLDLKLFNIFYVIHIVSWILFFPGLYIISEYILTSGGPTFDMIVMIDFIAMPISIIPCLTFAYRCDTAASSSSEHHQD